MIVIIYFWFSDTDI